MTMVRDGKRASIGNEVGALTTKIKGAADQILVDVQSIRNVIDGYKSLTVGDFDLTQDDINELASTITTLESYLNSEITRVYNTINS